MGALSNIDPTAVAVWASAVVLFALIAVLRAVFKLNFSLLTVLALGLGIALSLVFDGQVDSLNLLGNIYINLITALVAPLIFVSIISSITYVGSLKKLRSIGLRSVGWLLLTNLIAIVMTLGVAIPLHIGSGVKLVDDESTTSFLTSQTAPLDQVILNFFPKNIVGDLSGNRVVPIIITATVLAIAIVSVGRQKDVSVVKRFFEQTKGVIYKAVGYVVELTPYAVVVLGATSTAATTSKADALLALLSILVLGFVLNIIQAFVVNGLLLKFVAHVPPLTFFKAVLPAQTTAFATQSSVATLPLSIRQLGTVGVGADVANFTTPIGTTIGMPGCAGVWPMLSAVFTINALGLWGIAGELCGARGDRTAVVDRYRGRAGHCDCDRDDRVHRGWSSGAASGAAGAGQQHRRHAEHDGERVRCGHMRGDRIAADRGVRRERAGFGSCRAASPSRGRGRVAGWRGGCGSCRSCCGSPRRGGCCGVRRRLARRGWSRCGP